MPFSKSRTRSEELDLRTMRLLITLHKERSLSRAGAEEGISPGTASKLLQKAREAFSDTLFVRSGGAMIPTDRMNALAERLQNAVNLIESITEPDIPFSPATARGVVTASMSDNAALLLLDPVIPSIRRDAPGLRFSVETMSGDLLEKLRTGRIDLAIVMDETLVLGPSFRSRLLIESHHALLVGKRHPLAELAKKRPLEAADIAPYPKIGVTMEKPSGGLREILDGFVPEDDCAVRMPHFLAAAFLLEETDLVLTVPKEAAERLSRAGDLVTLEETARRRLPWRPVLIWHERTESNPLQQWVRSKIIEAAARLEAKRR